MASKKITAMPDLAGGQVPTDLTTLVDLSAVASLQNVKSTLNDLFAEITKNITDVSVQFGDGVAATVSAAGKGKIRYNNTAGSFQVSENSGAYQNLLKGSGTATRVAFWGAADEVSSNSDFYWDNVNERLGIGVGSTPDGPLDVLADGTALAQQWRQNAGPLRVQMILDNVPEGSLGTTTNHTFHLLSNNLQRLTVENGGLVGINKASAVQAQLQVVSLDATTETLILNSAASPSVNIAEFYNDSSRRFAFSPAGNLDLGLSGAGGATGSITINGVTSGAVTVNVASAAGTWTLTLPTTAGSAGQFLQTDGAGVTTWATAGGATINATDTLIPYRSSSSAFSDSQLIRLSSAITELRNITTGTTAQSLYIYGTAANNNASAPTNYRRLSLSSTGGSDMQIILERATASGGQFFIRNSSGGGLLFEVGSSYRWQMGTDGSFNLSNNALSTDVGIIRHAANTMRVTNASSGLGSLLIGASTDSLTGNFTVMSSNAATNSIVTVARLGVNSTGTAADGFGTALSWSAETSTTNDTETGRINVFWSTATHASRTSAMSFTLSQNASLVEVARLTTPSATVGSPFVLNVHDGTNPNVWTAGAFAAKLYLISPTLPAVGVAAHFSATALDAPQWQMLRGRGTNASPTAVQANDSIGNIEWWGQTSTSTNNVVAGARIRVSASENWSAGNNGCDMIFFVSNNAGTITERMSLARTGTLRIGATSGSTSTDNKLQIGNYASWNADAVAAIYTEADDNKGLEIIGTSSQTSNLFRVFLDAGADLFNILASGAFVGRVFTVATLPSAATAGQGARAFVSDALAPAILTAVAGGGAVKVPVYSDGTNWLVG